jgi:predicted SAM-dependent methyltransferase
MTPRQAKSAFFLIAHPLMWCNGRIYRYLRAPRTGTVKVHLGPGLRNYIAGWINLDANAFSARCDAWIDLRDSLPFPDSSVDVFYSHHVVEHLPDLRRHFREVNRCLKPGGVYRVAGPNGDSAIAKFVQGDASWFGDFPESRRSIGGRLENFIFCKREHLTLLTASFLEELLVDAGFGSVFLTGPRGTTRVPEHFTSDVLQFEDEEVGNPAPRTLVMEGVKAARQGGL